MDKRAVPMIHVPDVRATVEWYKELGFDVVATYVDETGEGLSFAIVAFGSSQVMFNQDGEPSTARRREVDLYVYTDDVDELYSRIKDRVDVVEGPHDTFYGMHELIIRDFNRFWITFGQESVFVADAPPAEIALEILQSYVGSYKGERGLAAEITLDDGQLYVTPTGQPTMRLWPIDQVTFRPISIHGVTIIFNVANGETVSFTLQHDDFKTELRRI
jgi:catechol 2,3-dioxygenase-like lactoylglutathione lyase family enzyme